MSDTAVPLERYPVFQEGDDDEAIINQPDKPWLPCRLCQNAFRRIRLTRQYCKSCKRAFCAGEHGNFAAGGMGRCTTCGDEPYKALKRQVNAQRESEKGAGAKTQSVEGPVTKDARGI